MAAADAIRAQRDNDAAHAPAPRYFEDLADGQRLPPLSVTLTEDDIIAFGRAYDPQPFHISSDEAGSSIFGELVASGIHTVALCTRLVVEGQHGLVVLSGLGLDAVSFTNPVRAGDTLAVEAWWSDLKRSASKPDRGFARLNCRVRNQDGVIVADYAYRYLIASKP
ncbi:MaoC/PaaZ C-terminal domain-containing protein [Amorphus orientalis]|uniref:Acyl dehydratase n=1 Tax=Amorphus orientalis TaxID=649198 RepID=A0AAE4ATK6_9HYPH|nr:MaoC/PaaZ C-terminal domain-containing protein [Amorphus orientalis]MDQ0317381.1 acyl dehydratase [Amorphus orientalis]